MSQTVTASATRSFAITPSDTDVQKFRALYVGGTGNIAIQHVKDGASTTFSTVPSGSILPIEGGLVLATGTTATAIVGLDW